MISVKNVSKSFNNQSILKNVSLEFPDKGLYFILGPSGCGKTTLLNCIAGLLDFEGEIKINGDSLKLLNDDEVSDYRLKNIGFVFQDFKLFVHDSVYSNVALPLKAISKIDETYQQRRVEDILDIVSMSRYKNELVNNLSGGEKQRVAIARAMINDPKVLLCDEPTGALDSVNKVLIMTILRTISSTRLVIVVSHDEELASKYADGIFQLKDGQVLKFKAKKQNEFKKEYLPIYSTEKKEAKKKIPFSFLFSHTKNAIKQRKFRSIITNIVVSFGLLGSGLAFMLSDTIYDSVVGMYSNIVSDNEIITTLKGKPKTSNKIISASKENIAKIHEKYSPYFDGEGICYLADFENYFPTCNELTIASTSYRYKLSGYSARNINEFLWLEDIESKIYPMPIQELRDDEIIISISPKNVRELCYQFRIEKTLESLSNYILKNDVFLCFNLANDNWQYYDEQILKLKGFVLDNKTHIYHSNHFWNKYMLEDMMRFPSNEDISHEEYYPWMLKKINYLRLNQDSENFLIKAIEDDELNDYVFELADKTYYPHILQGETYDNLNRLLVFKNTFPTLSPSDWKYMKSLQKSIKNPIFSTNSGYSIYGTSLLSGFNKVLFFANSQDILDTTTGIFASNGYDPTASINLPKGVLQGHYSKTSNNGVFFKGIQDKNVIGSLPNNVNEIVISTGMANQLFQGENPIGKHLKIAVTSYSYDEIESFYNFTFKNTDLLIVGTIENDKNILYQNEYWSLLFFQCKIGISIFELLPFGMSMEIDDKSNSQNVIKNLTKEFPQYAFSNPMKDIEAQADNLCFYMKIILLVLSLVTLIIAICLISICNYLHVLEIKKDIGLIRCIGLRKKEANKMLYFHSFFIAFLGAITTCVELLLFKVATSKGLNNYFSFSTQARFNILPYLFVFILSIVVALLPAYFTSFKLKKLDPLEAIKQ